MLKAGLIGLGGMGRGHLNNYIRIMKEQGPIELVAVCDVDPEKFKDIKVDFNIKGVVGESYDLSMFRQYTSADEMIANEKLDLVTIAIPTYLHAPMTVKCLNAGINVFCEKPMAITVEDCQLMIDTAKKNGKQLMIGQCLRFWGEYVAAKKILDSGELGEVTGGYFWRGGGAPGWCFENWYFRAECGGGCLRDQHVHDVDMIQNLFGMPKAVSTLGKSVLTPGAFDSVTTNYIYDGSFAINAQDDWSLDGHDFDMTFRINCEKGSMYMDRDGFRVCRHGEAPFTPEYDHDNAYYKEILYLADCIINGKENTVNPPEASLNTIRIVNAEEKSAHALGQVTGI